MSEHWEAAVEAAVENFHSHYDEPWPQTPPWLRQQIEHGLTAALPHLRRHIIAELREKAEGEGKRNREGKLIPRQFGGAPFPDVSDVAGAARWLAAQEEAK